MNSLNSNIVFSLELLQAISDWQSGSSIKKAEKLKVLCVNLPEMYRASPSSLNLYRQLSLDVQGLANFLRERRLPEKISSWTIKYTVAEDFKGGVPSEFGEFKATIFRTTSMGNKVIVNLSELYKCPDFCSAMKLNKDNIDGYWNGAGKYWDTQFEVVMATEYLDHSNIHSMGGHSGTSEQIAEQALRENNIQSPLTVEDIEELSRDYVGAWWLSPEGTKRVVARTLNIASARNLI